MIEIGIKAIRIKLEKNSSVIKGKVIMRLEMFARIAITTATYVAMMGSTQAAGLAAVSSGLKNSLQQHNSQLVMA